MYCKCCGNKLENNYEFCSNCGTKREIPNIQSNDIDPNIKNKLTKILGICVGVLFGISIVILFFGIIVCFPDPQTGENISGLSFDIFGTIFGIILNFAFLVWFGKKQKINQEM